MTATADSLTPGRVSRDKQEVGLSTSDGVVTVEAWAGGTTATTNTAGTTATEFDSTAWTRWALS
ncbi:hypothetical protein ACI3QN_11690, partial [Propionibacterium freudenreichii]